MKIKFFTKENRFKKKEFQFNPNFYWKLAICLIFIFMIFATFLGYNFFVEAGIKVV